MTCCFGCLAPSQFISHKGTKTLGKSLVFLVALCEQKREQAVNLLSSEALRQRRFIRLTSGPRACCAR